MQVYQTGLLSVWDAKSMLPGISSSLLSLFQSQQHPACLDVLADCVEYYARDPDVHNLFSHVLFVACSAAEPIMQVCWLALQLPCSVYMRSMSSTAAL